MSKKKSPIDNLFLELYGYYPPKAGQAYEMIVSAAFKLLLDKDIEYDQRLRGEYSETVYQLDGLVKDNSQKKMVEAKDYTIDNRKVGRGDLQKLQGALTDLPIDSGVFASATGFTKPASKFADSSEINPMNKSIELFDIRPSTEEDEKGRIKKIVINMSMHVADYKRGTFQPVFTKNGFTKLEKNGLVEKPIEMRLEHFYDKDRNIIMTLSELTSKHPPGTIWEEGFVSKGCWVIDGYFEIESELYEIKGLQYEVPFSVGKQELIIEGGGEPKIYIKSHDGEINKLISDKDLKKVKFENNKVINK